MKKMLFILALTLFMACGEKPVNNPQPVLADATDLKVEQIDENAARLTWKDNADGEKGYRAP